LKLPLVLPAAMATVVGGAAIEASELASVTTVPPAGAGPVRVRVPVTTVVALPFTVVGDTETDAKLVA